jgi:RIO kinase 1
MFAEYFRKKGVSTLTVKELFDFVTDVTITAENLDEYLDECMKITASRMANDITEEDKINEEVGVAFDVV